MAANVETMFYTREKPWHGLGTGVADAPDSADALRMAGLDWNVVQEFVELPDTYTIFITEKDFYGKGEPVYAIERMNLTTGESFEDGGYILYVNGEYRGESELGKLMYDFNCTEASDMNFNLMAERTRYLKENPEGVSEMCKAMEDMRNEAVERNILQTIRNLMDSMKWSAEQAMAAMKIPEDDRRKYIAKL